MAGRPAAIGPLIVTGTVIRVEVEHLPKPAVSGRVLKTLWLWWSGPGKPDLSVCWRAYIHRFDLEHTFRFAKNTLGSTTPRVRLPEQADRWTWLVLTAYTQLRLARGAVADCRLPWEPPRHPDRLTPTRVRRGFPRLVPYSALLPGHRNPPRLAPGGQKAAAEAPQPATPRSRRLHRADFYVKWQG